MDRDRCEQFGYHTLNLHDDQTTPAATRFDRFVAGPRAMAERAALIEGDAPHILLDLAIGLKQVTGHWPAFAWRRCGPRYGVIR